MTIPAGVTVRKPTAPARPVSPDNVLMKAARCDNVGAARTMINEALGIGKNSALAEIHLSWPERWTRMSPPSRLMELGAWINAECYECMDLVEMPAISTKGD